MAREEKWLLGQLKKHNVPEPSVKPPKGEQKTWKKGSKWTLMSHGKKFTSVVNEYVMLRREDIISKACEQITVVRVEIACFIDPTKTWDEWAAPLHAAQRVISTVRNQLTQLMLANDRAPDLFGDGARLTGKAFDVYKRVRVLQEDYAEDAAKRATKLEAEEKKLKKALAATRSKKTKTDTQNKLEEVQRKLATARADVALKFSGSTQSEIGRAAEGAYKDWCSKSFKKSVPNMRPNQPIPLRAGSTHPEWDVMESNKGYKVSFLVCSNTGRQYAALRVKNGKDHAIIRKYLKGEATRRTAKLFYDQSRKKWIIAMTFGTPRVPPADGGGTAAIRIGVQNFIFLLDDHGRFKDLETYHKGIHEVESHESFKRRRIIPRKLEFNDLKRAARKDRNFQGSGARGHGKRRFHRTYERHSDAEARFVKTWTGQVAAAAVKHCHRHNISKVYLAQMTTVVPKFVLENYMEERVAWLIKRFPFGTLRDSIVHALDKAGIQAIVTTDSRDCDTCPACGHEDKMNHNPRTMKFWCVECNTRLSADFAAAWNYMKKNGVDCSAIKKVSDSMQEYYQGLDEKKMSIAEEDAKFEAAHNNPEAAE